MNVLAKYEKTLSRLEEYLTIFDKSSSEQHKIINARYGEILEDIKESEDLLEKNPLSPDMMNAEYVQKMNEQKKFIMNLAEGYYKDTHEYKGSDDSKDKEERPKIPPNITALKYLLTHVIDRYKYRVTLLKEEK